MPHSVDNHYFELSLHLSDRQLFVEALFLSSKKDLGRMDVEEDMRKPLEPAYFR